jgi:hypothetical protein
MERTMKIGWLVIALAGLGLIAADPALARIKKKVHAPPPVYQYGQYIGQDPDANIRAYMKKDVWTGYAPP